MMTSRSPAVSRVANRNVAETRAQEIHQDDQGPLDRELLDLYVAILIAVPFACFLKSLWF